MRQKNTIPKRISILITAFLMVISLFHSLLIPVSAEGGTASDIEIIGDNQIYLGVGSEPVQLSYRLLPEDGDFSDEEVTFTYCYGSSYESGEAPIEVGEDGTVTALYAGWCNVEARIKNGSYVSWDISTYDQPESVSAETHYGRVGKQTSLSCSVEPYTAQDHPKEYAIADTSIATVDENGLITGISEGETEVTIKVGDAECTATVIILPGGNYASDIYSSDEGTDINISIGETRQLSYSLQPYSDYDQDRDPCADEVITWGVVGYHDEMKDSDNYVSVDQEGNVTGLQYGISRIRAVLTNQKYLDYRVNVVADPTGISFQQEEYYLPYEEGTYYWVDDLRRYLTIEPDAASLATVVFEPSDPDIMYQEYDYFIINKPGDVELTATTENGLSASTTLHFVEGNYIRNIEIDDVTMSENSTYEIEPVIESYTGDISDDEITYTLSSDDVIRIDGNTITALKGGNVRVEAVTKLGCQTSFRVSVVSEPKNIFFYENSVVITERTQKNLSLIFYPSTASGSHVEWNIDNEDVAELVTADTGSNYVLINAKKAGTTKLTATTDNGLSASVNIIVPEGEYAETISHTDSDMSMYKQVVLEAGESRQLDYVLEPAAPKDEKVKWHLIDYSGTGAISVDDSGTVTANGYGSAYVSAKITNGRTIRFIVRCDSPVDSLKPKGSPVRIALNNSVSINDLIEFEAESFNVSGFTGTIDDPTVLNVSGVSYWGVNIGTTTVHISGGGKSTDVEVEVYKPVAPAEMTIPQEKISLYVGYRMYLDVGYQPATADRSTTWTVDDPSILTVRQSKVPGVSQAYIEGKTAGTAVITVASIANPSITRQIRVTVTEGQQKIREEDVNYNIHLWDFENMAAYPCYPEDENKDSYLIFTNRNYGFSLHYVYDSKEQILSEMLGGANIDKQMEQSGFLQNRSGTGDGIEGEVWYSTMFTATKAGEMTLEIYPGKTIQIIAVDTAVTAPTVNAGDSVSEDVRTALKSITDLGIKNELITDVDYEQICESAGVTAEKINALDAEGKKVVIQTHFEIVASEMEKSETDASITLNIKPVYQIVILPKDADNTAASTEKPLAEGIAEMNDSISMDIPTGSLFDGLQTEKVYITHTKSDGRVFQYEGLLKNGKVSFVDPNGFSTFVISGRDRAAAKISGIGYLTIEDAVNAIASNQTLTITDQAEDGTVVTISKAVTFILNNEAGKTIEFKAGRGFALTVDGNVYTVVRDGIAVESVKLDQNSLKTGVGRTETLNAVIEPADATNQKMLWESDNTDVAEVDENGNITAKKVGKAEITVMTEDGNHKDTCEVSVLFDDVTSPDQYYYDAVYWAVENGITQGNGPTLFAPGNFCKRYHFVLFLWREEGCPKPTLKENPFKDVHEDDVYYDAVMWAVEKGITTGIRPDTFAPKDTLTRGQVVTFLYRAAGKPPVTTTANPFKDVGSDKYYYTPVLWAVENKITTGVKPDQFQPIATCTRGQTVVFMHRQFK